MEWGSEDAAYYFEKIPGAYYVLNTRGEDEIPYLLHNSKTKIDENVLYKGCAILVQGAIDFLNK